jgi:hypothetical protein
MAKTKTVIKTENAEDVINNANGIGDQFNNMFELKKDVKVGLAALAGYKVAISASKELIKYKKLTGSPETIAFFEGKS